MAGAVLTAAQLNEQLRDNGIEIRGGGIAISSQAALDFIYASSATQLGRLAKGSGLQSIRLNSGASAYEFFTTAPLAEYDATLTNVTDSTQTTTLSFTAPANEMADGDVIVISIAALVKNNKGTDGTATWDLAWGGVSATLVESDCSTTATTWSNNANERKKLFWFWVQRIGADLWAGKGGSQALGSNVTGGAGDCAAVLSAPTFSSNQTVALKLTLSATDATFYFKPQAARVIRYGT